MGKKHLLAILSSPRKNSNSSILAEYILQGAVSAGAEVETVRLAGLDIKPCRGCYACAVAGAKGCVQQDDMTSLYPKILAADALVLATPVYFFTMSGQLKVFIDRSLAAFYSKQGLVGKRLALAMAYGGEDAFESGCVNAIRTFQDICRYSQMTLSGHVYGMANDPGEIAADTALLDKAKKLGVVLAS